MFARVTKAVPAIAAAALIAAAITVIPGTSDEVEASPPVRVTKSDRLDIRPVGPSCSKQAWPYYEANCIKDSRQAMSQAKAARVVTADRVSVDISAAKRLSK
jgi:hypothetical protein